MRGPRPRPLTERFEEKVDRSDGQGPRGDCHEWRACRTPAGYGMMNVGGSRGRMVLAHRIAWYLKRGGWPKKQVRHTCDNPPCVRIEHLVEGSQADNLRDMRERGRQVRGERVGGAKLTAAQVLEIRERRSESQRALAAEFGVSQAAVSMVVTRRNWAHL